MKIGANFSSFNISAKGMGVQKKKMDVVAENIANASTTKTQDGTPYKRKILMIEESGDKNKKTINSDGQLVGKNKDAGINTRIQQDSSKGEMVYMPEHPDADKDGYLQMPNVDIVTEMIDMISATRNYEANLTAFNASKQIAKDSLEI